MEKKEKPKNKIDARGLACPQPVILTRKGLESNDRVAVVVDDEVALENITRLGQTLGCTVRVESTAEGTHEIHLTKTGEAGSSGLPQCGPAADGPFVLVFSSNKMGRGDDELGDVLVRAFIHTICEQEPKPDKIVFYNTGVKLAAKDSDVVDDLKALEKAGVELIVCGTCAKYFDLSDQLGAGAISNMYVIAETLRSAGRLVIP